MESRTGSFSSFSSTARKRLLLLDCPLTHVFPQAPKAKAKAISANSHLRTSSLNDTISIHHNDMGESTHPPALPPPLVTSRPHSPYAMTAYRSGLVDIVKSPPILSLLVAQLDWPDLLSFFNICKACRDAFREFHIRDLVLSRFIPGYAKALGLCDLTHYQDVQITLHDLALLLISQQWPLHKYPMHALRMLSTRNLTPEDDYTKDKLVALSQAHSRFVLLLQALVHSSSLPIPPEPEDTSIAQNRPNPTSAPKRLTFPAPLSYFKEHPTRRQQGVATTFKVGVPTLSKRSKHRSLPIRTRNKYRSTSIDTDRLSTPQSYAARVDDSGGGAKIGRHNGTVYKYDPADDVDSDGSEKKKISFRRSFFRSSGAVKPPPPGEPRTLQHYSKSWRRSISVRAKPGAGNLGSSGNAYAYMNVSDDDRSGGAAITAGDWLREPQRRFIRDTSSDSSLSNSPAPSLSLPFQGSSNSSSMTRSSSPSIPTPPSAHSSHPSSLAIPGPIHSFPNSPLSASRLSSPLPPVPTTPSPYPIHHQYEKSSSSSSSSSTPSSSAHQQPSTTLSVHDLTLATSRNRAPILRVFVPCSDMDFGSDSVLACEQQLIDAGLWTHLSTGDVVCNLGYIPPSPSFEDGGGVGGRREGGKEGDLRVWLLFDGQCLVPYSPPADVLPIPNPTSLPSPFYYAHIMPHVPVPIHGLPPSIGPWNNNENVVFRFDKFPPVLKKVKRHSKQGDDYDKTNDRYFDDDRVTWGRTSRGTAVRFELVKMQSKVRSKKAPGGWVEVSRWAWMAQVVVAPPSFPPNTTAAVPRSSSSLHFAHAQPQKSHWESFVVKNPPPEGRDSEEENDEQGEEGGEEEIGQGWYGQWVLEGEGTSEGRRMLEDMLNGRAVKHTNGACGRDWEVVREKSGGGQVWLRLIPC